MFCACGLVHISGLKSASLVSFIFPQVDERNGFLKTFGSHQSLYSVLEVPCLCDKLLLTMGTLSQEITNCAFVYVAGKAKCFNKWIFISQIFFSIFHRGCNPILWAFCNISISIQHNNAYIFIKLANSSFPLKKTQEPGITLKQWIVVHSIFIKATWEATRRRK